MPKGQTPMPDSPFVPSSGLYGKTSSYFGPLDDSRVQGRTKYPLPSLVMICLIGIMAGCNGWLAIREYIAHYSYFFMPFLGLADIPSVDTIARAIAKVDPAQLCDWFLSVAAEQHRATEQRKRGRPKNGEVFNVISLDGKAITGSLPRGKGKTDVHIVNAVVKFLVLAVRRVTEKSNEITAFPLILDSLFKNGLLKRAVVTIDAMGCQVKIAKQIIEYKANWLFGLKGNQGTFHNQIQDLFTNWIKKWPDAFHVERHVTPSDKKSGRIDWRVVTVVYLDTADCLSWLTKAADWAGIKSVVMVERHVEEHMVKGVLKEAFCDTRYYITSLDLGPAALADIVTGHWKVEVVHNQLDVSLREDKCSVNRGKAGESLSALRKLGLNIFNYIRSKFGMSVPRISAFCHDCPDYLMHVLFTPLKEIIDPAKWLDWRTAWFKENYPGTPSLAMAA